MSPRSPKKHSKPRNERLLKRIAVLPTLMTLLNAVCGFTAISFAARGMNDPTALLLIRPEMTYFTAAAVMILLAMVADVMDGQLARLAQQTSSFGRNLDSISDMVSFGAAPAFLMLVMVESGPTNIAPADPFFGSIPGRLIWLIAVMYVCCTALRLARFNVEEPEQAPANKRFNGLPSPAAAGAIVSLVLLYNDLISHLQQGNLPQWTQAASTAILFALPPVTALVALLMVSQVPYQHVVKHTIHGRRPFGYVARVVVVALLLYWQLQLTLAVSFMVYWVVGATRFYWKKFAKKERPLPEDQTTPADSPESLTQP
ncbi:MAG: phosphatidylcholine/phosphatidylserine synthase [Planctomycetes bacterium]|nr:phosphatidylcholine/phosphatidylserine synthase [Planctomycetota bacterium]